MSPARQRLATTLKNLRKQRARLERRIQTVEYVLREVLPAGPQGFASLTRSQRRLIAASGGKAAQANGTGHRWTPDEARAEGKKGGSVKKS